MWPTLYELQTPAGAAGLHSYGLMVLLALTAGGLLVLLRARDVGVPVERLPLAFVPALLGGFVGAKVLYAVSVGDPASLASLTGGYAFYGGVLGGGAAVLAASRPLGLDGWKLADLVMPGVVLGAAIGRVGCLLAGCCHGAPLPDASGGVALLPDGLLHGQVWGYDHFPFVGLEFHAGVGRYLHEPLYPTQLWQSVGSLVLLAVLLAVSRFRRFDGQVAAAWLVLEPLLRGVVEAFRADTRGYVVSWPVEAAPAWLPLAELAGPGGTVGVTTSQGLGLAMIVLGLAIAGWRRGRGVTPGAPSEEAWGDDLAQG